MNNRLGDIVTWGEIGRKGRGDGQEVVENVISFSGTSTHNS